MFQSNVVFEKVRNLAFEAIQFRVSIFANGHEKIDPHCWIIENSRQLRSERGPAVGYGMDVIERVVKKVFFELIEDDQQIPAKSIGTSFKEFRETIGLRLDAGLRSARRTRDCFAYLLREQTAEDRRAIH